MKKNLLKAAIASAVFAAGASYASIDGTLGNTSTGSIDVNLSKGNLVQISFLGAVTDAIFGNFTGVGNLDQTQVVSACIYSTTGAYELTPSGIYTSGINGYAMDDGLGNLIPYALTHFDGTNTTAFTNDAVPVPQAAANALPSFLNADTISTTCGGVPNASFTFDVLGADIDAAPAGVYTDTVTLIVSPI